MVNQTTVEATALLGAPPAEPPPGCAFPAVWRLAHELYQVHQDQAGICPGCAETAPCPGNDLARQGLATALGQQVPMSGYWHALAGVRRHTRVAS